MKSPYTIFTIAFLVAQCASGQGLYERFPISTSQSIHLFGYETDKGRTVSSGTGALYMVPHDPTNEAFGTPVIVTAKHTLYYPHTTNLLPALLIKLNIPKEERRARFIVIPLKHDAPRNYWISERGLDLLLLPYPLELIDINAYPMFRESGIITSERAADMSVGPGLLVYTVCHQPEYFDDVDFFLPTSTPIVRFGHLARLGWEWYSRSNFVSRSHVIDMHSSPGNSGATVVLNVVTKDTEIRQSCFLGIVQGYQEEKDSYLELDAPLKKIDTSELQLTSDDMTITNHVAITTKTLANPDLTSVTPVDELVGVWNSSQFKQAILVMLAMQDQYQLLNGPLINSE